MTTTTHRLAPPTSPSNNAEPATGATISIVALALLNIVAAASLGGPTAQGEWTDLDQRQLIRLLTDFAS